MSEPKKRRKRDGDEDEVEELVDLHVERVDAVTEPATRLPFLLIKSLDGEEAPSLDELLQKAMDKEGGGGGESEREKLREEQKKRSERYGIGIKDDTHLTPPKGYPKDPDQYGDPVNYRYPIDEEHILAAVSYFNHEGQREAGGYTPEEWATIGRRIAQAANRLLGEGYKYADGKIVTPNTDDKKEKAEKGVGEVTAEVQKQVDDAPELNGVPGSPEWEKLDASLLQEATRGLVALKHLLQRVVQREQMEASAGVDEGGQITMLLDALGYVTQALKHVAGAAALEEAEAGEEDEGGEEAEKAVAKAGRVMSRKNMERVHAAMHHLARAAGFSCAEDFLKAAKEMGFAKVDEDEETEKARRAPTKGEEDTEKAKVKDKPEAEAEKAKKKAKANGEEPTETKKSLDASDEASAVVMKALEATGLTRLAQAAETLLKAAETIPRLEERVKALEDQPLPGGPMLRGRATMSDYYLVRKGDDPVQGLQGTALEQVLDRISDPYLRDVLSREVARSLHPAHKQQ